MNTEWAMPLKVSVLTGGRDSHYALPLVSSLAAFPVSIDVIRSEEFPADRMPELPNVELFSMYRLNAPGVRAYAKVLRLAVTYLRLLAYAVRTDSQVFHTLWFSRFELADALVLNPIFRLLGKVLIFTAHNVDAGVRDGSASTYQRWLVRRLYRQMDHVFVHTEKMKRQLEESFGVAAAKITIIPFGLNTVVPESALTKEAAREKLGIGCKDKLALFFGHITAYKGIEYLIEAIALLREAGSDVRLIVAGGVKDRAAVSYHRSLVALIERLGLESAVTLQTEFIPDEDVEIYLKAADVCVLPYTEVFQSGVLFLAYRFGLPVVATDVGSLRDDVIEGRTGFISRRQDPADLAETLQGYFESRLFTDQDHARRDIRQLATDRNSWSTVAAATYDVYRTCCIAPRRTTRALDCS